MIFRIIVYVIGTSIGIRMILMGAINWSGVWVRVKLVRTHWNCMKVIYLRRSSLCNVMIVMCNFSFVIGRIYLVKIYLNCFLILVRKIGTGLMIVIPVRLKGLIMLLFLNGRKS